MGAVLSAKLFPGPGKERDCSEVRMGGIDAARVAPGRRSETRMPIRKRDLRLMLVF